MSLASIWTKLRGEGERNSLPFSPYRGLQALQSELIWEAVTMAGAENPPFLLG